MRTCVYIDDDVYKKLVNESIDKFGTAKNISEVLNFLLREILQMKHKQKKEDYSGKFGKLNFSLNDVRDKDDRVV